MPDRFGHGPTAGANPSVRGRAARPDTEGVTRTFVRGRDTRSGLFAACTLTDEGWRSLRFTLETQNDKD